MKTGITIKLTNYGTVTIIGSYGRNLHDAYKALRNLEFDEFIAYGYLPETIKYYIEYKEKGQTKTITHSPEELRKYGIELLEKLNRKKDTLKAS